MMQELPDKSLHQWKTGVSLSRDFWKAMGSAEKLYNGGWNIGQRVKRQENRKVNNVIVIKEYQEPADLTKQRRTVGCFYS